MKLRSVLVYTVLRLLAFLVPLGLLLLLPIFQQNWLLAAVFAAVLGLAISLLFLRRPLEDVSAGIAQRRGIRRMADEDVEDAAVGTADERARSAHEGPEEDRRVTE